ncbi:gliding motility protein GldM [Tunicatimonas pelagia]|uniref:type IX secretion system motor protein PorM/GldM n=1 Tax=Tunicatimonas pelagia TaxID=931531 RepID=UPI0026650E10|nr:gliding motility protein GldM [Tunicatimonas pelagia]WKN41820.1 gliding motility protein GldM [Tunicatimonas pelagia]
MAGGKETPRQKMIGMMYLVLTALLALQVSNTILDRFVFIDQSLDQSAESYKVKNSGTVDRIRTAVEEAGNREEDVVVLKKAQEVRAKTNNVVNKLNEYRAAFIEKTGGEEENGTYAGGKNEDEVANLMIRQKKGDELKKTLNDYAQFVAKESGTEFEPLALDGRENPVFKDNPDQNKKSFAELNFQNTPMVAGLATLNDLKTKVLARETSALDALARQVGAADLKFDDIKVMVRPKSNVVAAGTTYEADLFIAASSSAVTPKMLVNGKPVPVEGGMGKIKFPASASKYDKDNRAEQKFKATIQIDQGANSETYEETFSYFVTKPVIQVQSQAMQALYLNCANDLQVNVPALGSTYKPSFTASGGTAIAGAKTGQVTVIPKAAKVNLSVSSNGFKIGTESFRVKPIPKPTIEVLGPGNKPVNLKQGEAANRLRSITLKAMADEDFASVLPKEARYRVVDAEIFLARGSRPIGKAKYNASNGTASLNDIIGKAKAGDRIVVDVKKVQRMNSRNEREDVRLGSSASTITVPIK